MADLQSVHAPRVSDREDRFNRGADGGAERRADAAEPADQARMARGGAGGSRRAGTAFELKPAGPGLIWETQILRIANSTAGLMIDRQLAQTGGHMKKIVLLLVAAAFADSPAT